MFLKHEDYFIYTQQDKEYELLKELLIEAASNTGIYRNAADCLRKTLSLVKKE